MSNVEAILESIEKLTLIEASELVKAMEEKFGVSAAAPVAVAAAPAAGAAAAEASDAPSEVTVVLASAGANKIPVLKIVREITGLGLKEAKDLVDGAPKPIKENVKKEEADGRSHIEYKGLSIDMEKYQVIAFGNKMTFNAKERELLWCLASNPGKAFSRNQLLETIWGYSY